MRIPVVLCILLSLVLIAGGPPATAQGPTDPPQITAETADQLTLRQTIGGDERRYYRHELSPDGSSVMYQVQDADWNLVGLSLFDTYTGEERLVLLAEELSEEPPSAINPIPVFSPDNTSFLVMVAPFTDDPGEIIVFGTDGGAELRRFPTQRRAGGPVYALDGSVLVIDYMDVETYDDALVALDAASGEILGETPLPGPSSWLCAQGDAVAYNTFDGDVVVRIERDEAGGVSFSEPVYASAQHGFGYYAFAPDGSAFTIIDRDAGEIRLYSALDGTLQAAVPVSVPADTSIGDAYSNGELVVVSLGSTVRVYDLEGTLLVELEKQYGGRFCRIDAANTTLMCSGEKGGEFWGVE